MLFPNGTLDALVKFYLEARSSGSARPVFAHSGADVFDILTESVHDALRQCCVENRPFQDNGQFLTPWNVTAGGGALLCAFVNAQGKYALLLAPMCENISENKEYHLRDQFVKEIASMQSKYRWDNQKGVINRIAFKYTTCNMMPLVLQEKKQLVEQNRILCDSNRELTLDKQGLEDEVKELTLDKNELIAHVETLKSEIDDLSSKLEELHRYVDEKEQEIQEAKDNAPESSFVEHIKAMDRHVKAVTVDTGRFECTFKAKGPPPADSTMPKTSLSARADRVPKTPIARSRPASSSSPDSVESIM